MADSGTMADRLPMPGHGVAAWLASLRRVDVLCLAGLMAGGALTIGLLFATPALLQRHPVLLEALNASPLAMVTGGAYARVGHVALPLVVLAPLLVILIYDVFAWWAGRLRGRQIIDAYSMRRSARARRRAERAETLIRHRGVVALAAVYLQPIPHFLVYLACGSTGMPLWLFLLGDAIGTLVWAGLLTGLGWSVGQSAVSIVNSINHYSLIITVVVIVIALLFARRRMTSLIRGARSIAREAMGRHPANVRKEFSLAGVHPRDARSSG